LKFKMKNADAILSDYRWTQRSYMDHAFSLEPAGGCGWVVVQEWKRKLLKAFSLTPALSRWERGNPTPSPANVSGCIRDDVQV